MKFLIVPADLEPKELIVYAWLYRHSNQTQENYKGLSKNEVYASSRKIADQTEIPQSTVARILTKLIKEYYIKEIYKSRSKKEPSKYYLIFNESVGESHIESDNGSVDESVSESVVDIVNKGIESNSKTVTESVGESDYGSVTESVGDSKSNNISSNKSDNKSINISKDNIYLEIFNYYLSLDLVKHKSLTPAMKKAIHKAMNENKYSLEDCKTLLERHKLVVEVTKNNQYPVKVRTIQELFGQKIKDSTALICTQYDIGGKYYNLAILNQKEGGNNERTGNNSSENKQEYDWTKNTKPANLTEDELQNIDF